MMGGFKGAVSKVGISIPAAMAMPPTLGTGTACTLRAPGRSVRPTRGAHRSNAGVQAVVIERAIRAAISSGTANSSWTASGRPDAGHFSGWRLPARRNRFSSPGLYCDGLV